MDTGIRPLFQRTRARSRERERDSRPSSFPLSAPLLDIHLRYRSPGRKNTRITTNEYNSLAATVTPYRFALCYRSIIPTRFHLSHPALFTRRTTVNPSFSLSAPLPRHDTRATSVEVFIDWPGSGERCNDSRTHARGGIRGISLEKSREKLVGRAAEDAGRRTVKISAVSAARSRDERVARRRGCTSGAPHACAMTRPPSRRRREG